MKAALVAGKRCDDEDLNTRWRTFQLMRLTHRSPEQIDTSSALDNDWWLALSAIEDEAGAEKAERDAERKGRKRKFFGR